MNATQTMHVTPTTAPDGLNIRTGAGRQFPIVVTVVPDALLTVVENAGEVGKSNKWVKVRTVEGKEGWTAAWLLEAVEPTLSEPEPETLPEVLAFPDWPARREMGIKRCLQVVEPGGGGAHKREWAAGTEHVNRTITLHLASVADLQAILRDDVKVVTLDL